MTPPPQTPFERLRAVLLPRERIAVALSGGLDSSWLLPPRFWGRNTAWP